MKNLKLMPIGKAGKSGGMKSGTKVFLWILVIAVIATVAVVVLEPTQQTQLETQKTITSTLGNCETEPYVDLKITDGVNPGTSVSFAGGTYSLDGKFVGSFVSGSSGTTFNIGDKGVIQYGKSNYLNETVPYEITKCGANVIQAKLFATDDATVAWYNDDDNSMGAAYSGTNQTESTSAIRPWVKLTINQDESVGTVAMVIQYANDTEVDDITVTNKDFPVRKIEVPEAYTGETADSQQVAYELDLSKYANAGEVEIHTLLTAASGQTIGGSTDPAFLNATFYTYQYFNDIDGTYKYGVEDSDGTAKYEDTFTVGADGVV